MWLMLNDAFLSFVSKDCKPSELLVRARRPGDIQKIFPKAKVTEYDKSDYQFRAVVTRVAVEEAMVGEVKRIVYSNFKNSVRDNPLHDAYMDVWTTMSKLQPKAPYSGWSKAGQRAAIEDTFFDFGAAATLKPKKQQVRKAGKKLTKGQ